MVNGLRQHDCTCGSQDPGNNLIWNISSGIVLSDQGQTMQGNACANYKLPSGSRQKVQSSAAEIQSRIQQCDGGSKRKPFHHTRGCLQNERTVADYQLLNLDKKLFTNHLFRVWILSNVDINNNVLRSCAYRIIIFYDPVHMVQQSACWFLVTLNIQKRITVLIPLELLPMQLCVLPFNGSTWIGFKQISVLNLAKN